VESRTSCPRHGLEKATVNRKTHEAQTVHLMLTIATIGFAKKGAERFIQLLSDASVSTIIDTRRRPDSPLSGYARQRDLPFILRAAGIDYEYRSELAPPDALLNRYRADKDWAAYERDFDDFVLNAAAAETAMGELITRSDRAVFALLCSEPTPERCHRRLIVERMKQIEPALQILHL
jgi:uncharacterized protein (DUF488 family)